MLQIDHNSLQSLTLTAKNYPAILSLYASHNQISKIEITCSSIETINLNSNKLETMEPLKLEKVYDL